MKLNCVCFIIGFCYTFSSVLLLLRNMLFSWPCSGALSSERKRIYDSSTTTTRGKKKGFNLKSRTRWRRWWEDKDKIKTNLLWLSELRSGFTAWHDVESSSNWHRRWEWFVGFVRNRRVLGQDDSDTPDWCLCWPNNLRFLPSESMLRPNMMRNSSIDIGRLKSLNWILRNRFLRNLSPDDVAHL